MKIHRLFRFILLLPALLLLPILAFSQVASMSNDADANADANTNASTTIPNAISRASAVASGNTYGTNTNATLAASSTLANTTLTSNTANVVNAGNSGNSGNVGNTAASTGLLQIFLALIFIICLMLFGAWLLKRINPMINNHKVNVKIVGGTSIGNRERIVVVEILDQWIVVGVTATQINTLSTMPKVDLPTEEKITPAMPLQFSTWLKKTIDKRSNDASSM